MPGGDFQAVRSRVSMRQVLELLGFVPSVVRGDQVYGQCPIDRSAARRGRSFSAKLAKNNYRCFVCGAQGNPLDLWAAATHPNLFAAAVDLCEQLHTEVPWIRRW